MRTPALLGRLPTSPPHVGVDRSARAAPNHRQTRLVRRLAWRASRGISWTHGILRRSRGLFHTPLGRQARRVRGIFAGLSNTRWADVRCTRRLARSWVPHSSSLLHPPLAHSKIKQAWGWPSKGGHSDMMEVLC